jgi:hypothetical protein
MAVPLFLQDSGALFLLSCHIEVVPAELLVFSKLLGN